MIKRRNGSMIGDYINNRINEFGEIEEESQIREVVEGVKKQFNTKCDFFYAGGFDSPGYVIDCYLITYIDKDGEIKGKAVSIECY
jgi:hypothetical protein